MFILMEINKIIKKKIIIKKDKNHNNQLINDLKKYLKQKLKYLWKQLKKISYIF